MFVLYLFALFNLGFMYCSTELQEMTSTVTLDMGFNFKEISTLPTDFCPWQVSFLQPWDTITQLIAMSCSGCYFSNKLRLWGNWIYWHTIWVLWKILVVYPEKRSQTLPSNEMKRKKESELLLTSDRATGMHWPLQKWSHEQSVFSYECLRSRCLWEDEKISEEFSF